MYVYTCICMFVCMHACMHACTHTQIHILYEYIRKVSGSCKYTRRQWSTTSDGSSACSPRRTARSSSPSQPDAPRPRLDAPPPGLDALRPRPHGMDAVPRWHGCIEPLIGMPRLRDGVGDAGCARPCVSRYPCQITCVSTSALSMCVDLSR